MILGIHDILPTRCTLIYLPPDNDGGALVTGYLLEYRSPGSKWIAINSSPITGLKRTIHNLSPSTKYKFRVAAVNREGTGCFSEASGLITTKAASVPGQPGRPIVVQFAGTSVKLEWKSPEDGGKDIASYVVRYGVPGTDTHRYSEARLNGQVPSCTMSRFKSRTKYHFAIAAVNKLGRGPLSKFSEQIFTYKNKSGELCEISFMTLINQYIQYSNCSKQLGGRAPKAVDSRHARYMWCLDWTLSIPLRERRWRCPTPPKYEIFDL